MERFPKLWGESIIYAKINALLGILEHHYRAAVVLTTLRIRLQAESYIVKLDMPRLW